MDIWSRENEFTNLVDILTAKMDRKRQRGCRASCPRGLIALTTHAIIKCKELKMGGIWDSINNLGSLQAPKTKFKQLQTMWIYGHVKTNLQTLLTY